MLRTQNKAAGSACQASQCYTLASATRATHRTGRRSCLPVASIRQAPAQHPVVHNDRRALLAASACVLLGLQGDQPAFALPLAPLGPLKRGREKHTKLSIQEVLEILRTDIGERMYFVTGGLTEEIFDDECRFVDPTNDVTGLSKYVTALGILFDPKFSKVILKDIRVTGPSTIEADYVSAGYLRLEYFPWNARVDPYAGHITYTLGVDGLIKMQAQTWSISPLEALRETFRPTSEPRHQLL